VRYKIILEIDADKCGNILPISYQYELVSSIDNLLMADQKLYSDWLAENGFQLKSFEYARPYCISNFYIPKIFVDGDRLQIKVPRIQFWFSTLLVNGTDQFMADMLLQKEIIISDHKSGVCFRIADIQIVSPIIFHQTMDYQSLSPIVEVGMRPNGTVEYMHPQSLYFSRFLIDELIERWEMIYNRPYQGDRRYTFELLAPEKRKAQSIFVNTDQPKKIIGYMLKFRLTMAPELQEFAYDLGVGDNIDLGFGYLELLKK